MEESRGWERRTDEHERIGHIVVAHVDDGRANPAAKALLRTVENGVHHARRLGCRLHAVQALTSIAQTVRNGFGEQILFGQRPEVEHV